MLASTLLALSCEGVRCAEPLFRQPGLTIRLMIGGLSCCKAAIAVFGLAISSLYWSRRLTISTGIYEQYYNVQSNFDLPQLHPFPCLRPNHDQP